MKWLIASIVVAGLVLLGCSSMMETGVAQPGEPPARQGVVAELTAAWSPPPDRSLGLTYRVWNQASYNVEFEFHNSGRVCGVVREPAGQEIYRFPQITAQVMGTEKLRSGEDRSFRHEIPRQELGEGAPGSYTVEAWLCGYEDLRATANFVLAAQS